MLKKIFALAFVSAVASVAIASEPTSLELQRARAQEAVAQEAAVSDVSDADELKQWGSAKECAAACKAQNCTGSQYISNGNGGGSCTCNGCSYQLDY